MASRGEGGKGWGSCQWTVVNHPSEQRPLAVDPGSGQEAHVTLDPVHT